MDIFNQLAMGFGVIFSVYNLAFCLLGCLVGTLIGVLPGLGPVATLSLLLPITFGMEPVASIIMLAGVYYGAQYGGSTTSILVNIPGEAASIVTCIDGYQMAQKGRAGAALGISAFGSFIGGTASVLGLMLLAPMLAKAALAFGPPEYFSLMFLGMTLAIFLCTGSIIKGLIMAVAGLALSLVGLDPVSGSTRFTLGSLTLMGGVGIVPVAMGMFGIGEVLTNMEQGDEDKQEVLSTKIKELLPNLQDWKDSTWPIIRGSLLGFFVGIIPGSGGIITSLMSYTLEKKLSRHPEKFGTGAIEGVAGPETANNSTTGGSMVPLLSLGIPSNASMAVLLGAFMIHGIHPGPLLMTEHPQVFWGTIASMYIGNIMLVILNVPLIGLWVKILKIPYNILAPLILLFCFIGAYSVNNNSHEILMMAGFGLFGYITRKFGYEGAPFLLALVLGPMFEMAFRQSMLYGDPFIMFKRPISMVLLSLALLLIVSPIFSGIARKRTRLIEEENG